MAATGNLPILSSDNGLSRYLSEIRKFPMMEKQQEFMLAKAWADHGDTEAAHKLVTSHLRLAAKIAMGYRGYGLPISEVISEANVGLMQSVKRFDPDKGFRLSTYAMWWIRAAIQEYILRSWSLVKIGTTASQKKLFFNLRRAKSKINALEDGQLRPEQVESIAKSLAVSEEDVVMMNGRMGGGGDASLNAPMRGGGEDGGTAEWMDWLPDEESDHAAEIAQTEEYDKRMSLLDQAMATLNEREQHILRERRLRDDPMTLEDLSNVYDVSRERIRQIEVRAFEKLQDKMRALAADEGLIEAETA
jgi:RNA polymerase sigma-32 factor